MIKIITTFIAFQIAWFCAVLGGAYQLDFAGSCPALALFAVHITRDPQRWYASIRLVGAILILGMLAELIFISSGVLIYKGATASAYFPPLWILALWLAFATLPEGALSWMAEKPLTQSLFGAVGGPLSYGAGEKLGAATLNGHIAFSIGVFALVWAAVVPLSFHLVRMNSRLSFAKAV